jgi:membrane fusion protein (multidrug efflux system)
MIKRFIIAIVLLVVVCGGLIYFNFFRDQMVAGIFANMQAPAQTVDAAKVEPTRWTPGIEAIGTAKASMGVDVAAEVPGVVKSIAFQANDEVVTGEPLVQIDDAVERADLQSAEAALARDQRAYDRNVNLSERGVTSTKDLEDAQAALEASRSALERVRAVIAQKAILAPFAGTIGIPQIEIGEYLQAGDVVATLQNTTKLKVDFTVPEQIVSQLSMGQPAAFGAEVGELNYRGTIIGIDPKIDPATRLVQVQALVDNPDGSLRPGQFVRVRIELPAEDDVITVPQTAVVSSLYGDFIYVVVPGQGESQGGAPSLVASQVFVTIGRRDGNVIEIAKGLEAGQTIVTSGQNKLFNGAPILVAPGDAANGAVVAEQNG